MHTSVWRPRISDCVANGFGGKKDPAKRYGGKKDRERPNEKMAGRKIVRPNEKYGGKIGGCDDR